MSLLDETVEVRFTIKACHALRTAYQYEWMSHDSIERVRRSDLTGTLFGFAHEHADHETAHLDLKLNIAEATEWHGIVISARRGWHTAAAAGFWYLAGRPFKQSLVYLRKQLHAAVHALADG